MEEILKSGLAGIGLNCDNIKIGKFKTYYDFLAERNAVMNLTSIEGEEQTAKLHFLDSCSVITALPKGECSLIDVGTGAGFPGVPLKIMRPDLKVTLLDSLQKRVDFQTELCNKLDFDDVNCIFARAEEAAQGELRESFDVATSRALARLSVLCELCLPFVKVGGIFIAMKGREAAEELSEAKNAIECLGGGNVQSLSYVLKGEEALRRLIVIEKLAPTPSSYPRRWARISKKPL